MKVFIVRKSSDSKPTQTLTVRISKNENIIFENDSQTKTTHFNENHLHINTLNIP